MKITTKIMLFINLMVVFILGILVFLTYLKYLNLVEEFTSSQAGVFSAELKQAAVRAETLGLKIENLRQFDEVLQRISHKEDRIDSIFVLNSRGKIISKFEREKTKAFSSKYVIETSLVKSKAGTTWTLFTEKNVGFGRYLFTDVVGRKIFAVFFYDRAPFFAENNIIKDKLVFFCLSVIGPSVFILGVVIFVIFRPIQTAYNQIRNETESFFLNSTRGQLPQSSEYGKSLLRTREALKARASVAQDENR